MSAVMVVARTNKMASVASKPEGNDLVTLAHGLRKFLKFFLRYEVCSPGNPQLCTEIYIAQII